MSVLAADISRIMDSALANITDYFATEFEMETDILPANSGEIAELSLREMTAIVGIGGTIDLFIAFSFEDSLINALYEQMADGLDISPEEAEEMKKATAAEIVNIAAGHCTTDLQDMDSEIIPITPPTVLDLVKRVPRLKSAIFHLRSIITAAGALDLYLIGPRELFSNELEYVK